MKKLILLLTVLTFLFSCKSNPKEEYDICIYGGTSAGVIAAYSAKMLDKKVLLIEPQSRLGGLTSGGLGLTDIGNKQVVTGLSKDFYRRLGAYYGKLEQWIFEPKVADSLFNDYIKRADVKVLYKYRITDAQLANGYIKNITLESSDGTKLGKSIAAKVFIDCTYEGDLMAKAGVSYMIGREDNKQYGETYNGVQLMKGHQFPDGVDPYKIKGDSTSGLLWGISPAALSSDGTGDELIQAYNYRICLTDNPANKIGFGWHCRYAIERGATFALGIDLSGKMLDKAREINSSPLIEYKRIAIEDFDFAPNSFDIVISSLTFHYLESFDTVCTEVYKCLTQEGVFVFSVEHPVFTAYGNQDWIYDSAGKPAHWPVDHYFQEGVRHARFLGEDVTKYHKTLTTYVNGLIKAGFCITHLVEPQPDESMLDTVPGMRDELHRPMMLLIAARKN